MNPLAIQPQIKAADFAADASARRPYLSIQPQIKAADVPLNDLAANPHISDSEKVAEVSRQFEAVLLRQILQEARKSSVAPSSPADASVSGIYDDMINNQLADSISRSGSFGLARSLQRELAHQVLPNASPAPPILTPLAVPLSKNQAANP
jgi:Rod binding domain-containing protein